MRRFWASSLPVILIAGGLVTVPQQVVAPASAVAAATTLLPSTPMKLERFYFYSSQPTKFVRPVVLQKKVGSGWRTIYSGRTAANGKYHFVVHTGSVDTLRSYSVAVRHGGRRYPASATTPVTVRPVTQKVAVSAASSTSAVVVATPGRNGRVVSLQRRSGSVWTTVATARTNASGRAGLTFKSLSGSQMYRAVASGWSGAPAVTSSAVTVTSQPNSCPISTSYIKQTFDDPYLTVTRISCIDSGRWALVDGTFWKKQSEENLLYQRSGSGWKAPTHIGHGSDCPSIPLDAPFDEIDKRIGGLCSAYADMWKSSGIITLPYDLGAPVTSRVNLKAYGVPDDLAAYLRSRTSSNVCGSDLVQVRLSKVRPDDLASGSIFCVSKSGEPGGGYASLWYKKAGTWHEFGTQDMPRCTDLRARGVPIPPPGFMAGTGVGDCEK